MLGLLLCLQVAYVNSIVAVNYFEYFSGTFNVPGISNWVSKTFCECRVRCLTDISCQTFSVDLIPGGYNCTFYDVKCRPNAITESNTTFLFCDIEEAVRKDGRKYLYIMMKVSFVEANWFCSQFAGYGLPIMHTKENYEALQDLYFNELKIQGMEEADFWMDLTRTDDTNDNLIWGDGVITNFDTDELDGSHYGFTELQNNFVFNGDIIDGVDPGSSHYTVCCQN